MDALFAADDSEHDEFAAAARLLTEWVAQARVHEIDLNAEAREDARERLLSMWGSLSWMTYLGHSGLDRMAGEGLLTSADVAALAPMSGTPFVVGWTCNMVRFDIPGYHSLGERLHSPSPIREAIQRRAGTRMRPRDRAGRERVPQPPLRAAELRLRAPATDPT